MRISILPVGETLPILHIDNRAMGYLDENSIIAQSIPNMA